VRFFSTTCCLTHGSWTLEVGSFCCNARHLADSAFLFVCIRRSSQPPDHFVAAIPSLAATTTSHHLSPLAGPRHQTIHPLGPFEYTSNTPTLSSPFAAHQRTLLLTITESVVPTPLSNLPHPSLTASLPSLVVLADEAAARTCGRTLDIAFSALISTSPSDGTGSTSLRLVRR
jgi:hypothetical protein